MNHFEMLYKQSNNVSKYGIIRSLEEEGKNMQLNCIASLKTGQGKGWDVCSGSQAQGSKQIDRPHLISFKAVQPQIIVFCSVYPYI